MSIRYIGERIGIGLLALLVALNTYVYARFTVDDAFITWRYAQNFVHAGIWGYNPTSFDLTQAYTNPILAILALVPAALHIDLVLFFKCFSLLCLLVPPLVLVKRVAHPARFLAMYLLLLVLPATMIHAFSGLETFLFTMLLGGLFIALIEARCWLVNLLTVLLMLTRPEAWLLLGLVPAYIAITPALGGLRRATQSALVLGSAFALYAAFHYLHFGYVLPNTYYIKSGQHLEAKTFIYFMAYFLPALVLWLTPHRRVLLAMACIYLPMIYTYASSDLQMNYANRFAYHIWAGIYLVLIYVMAQPSSVSKRLLGRPAGFWAAAACLASYALIAVYNTTPAGLIGMANQYPRLLFAHSALGKAIAQVHTKYNIQSFALSDAGAASYNAGIVAYDNTGLGSALVAHQGSGAETIDQYHPDLVMLRTNKDGVVLSSDTKKNLYAWTQKKGMKPMCDVVLGIDYSLSIFSRQEMPELRAVCQESLCKNAPSEAEFFRTNMKNPPWHYWHE